MRSRTARLAALLVMATLLVPASGSASQTVLGEWEDNVGTIWKQRIKIVKEGERFFRVSSFGDGSADREEIREVRARGSQPFAFRELETSDTYVIQTNGNLGLYDEDGFIREAQRLR